MNIAIIPARGGSKRIPNKNIKLFFGKPIIAYPIETALKCGLFNRVLVTTDSDEIAKIARLHGADVPFKRSPELSDDLVGNDLVLLHALKWLEKQNEHYDYACCIYPTAPFINAKDLQSGLNELNKHHAVSAVSVLRFPHPVLRSFNIDNQQRLKMNFPEYQLSRSQDLPESYHDAGQFYWVDVRKYLKVGQVFSEDTIPIILHSHRSVDIDTLDDWKMAEILYQANRIDNE